MSGPHSPLVTSHRSPLLIIRKKVSHCNNIITSSSLLMTHNLMLNVIRPWRRRQEFRSDQTYTTHCPVNICEVLNLKVKYLCSLVLTIFHGSLLCGNQQSPEASSLSSGQRSTDFHHIAGGATHPCYERRGMNATYPVKSQSLFLKFAKYLFLVLDKLVVVANIGRIPPPDQVGEGQPRYSTSETIGIILKSTSGANCCAG